MKLKKARRKRAVPCYELSGYCCFNKKKIRGWKKLLRRIEIWKNSNIMLDLNALENYKRDYLKITIDPWYRLVKRNPPVWYQRYLVDALCDIYLNWENEIKKVRDEFYLKMWLFEKNIINSQIVIAIDDKINFYNNLFFDQQTKTYENSCYFRNKFKLPKSLQFEVKIDYQLANNLADDLSPEEIKYYEKYSEKKEKNSDGSLTYYLKLDDVIIIDNKKIV